MENAELYTKIGALIRQRRKEKKVTGEQIGKLIGIGKSTYSMIENGKVRIAVDDLIRICNYLGIDWASIVDEASK